MKATARFVDEGGKLSMMLGRAGVRIRGTAGHRGIGRGLIRVVGYGS